MSCGAEPSITNAQAVVDSPDNTTMTATYTCNAGFSMTGSPRVTCNMSGSGTWPTSGLPSCSVILQDTIVTTNVYIPDIHEEWWFYLLAGLLGLIVLVLLIWLLCWCCCGLHGCCEVRGTTVYPQADQNGRSYRRRGLCCWGNGLSCECCCRKQSQDRRQNANSKGVYWMGTTNAEGKWEPCSPCTVCHSHNTLGSSGISSMSSPPSGRGPIHTKNHAHLPNRRGPNLVTAGAITSAGGVTQDQTNGNSSGVAEMYDGGGQGLTSVETPPPREAQIQRPVKPAKEPAKEAKIWMPHSNPIRQINTSTK